MGEHKERRSKGKLSPLYRQDRIQWISSQFFGYTVFPHRTRLNSTIQKPPNNSIRRHITQSQHSSSPSQPSRQKICCSPSHLHREKNYRQTDPSIDPHSCKLLPRKTAFFSLKSHPCPFSSLLSCLFSVLRSSFVFPFHFMFLFKLPLVPAPILSHEVRLRLGKSRNGERATGATRPCPSEP